MEDKDKKYVARPKFESMTETKKKRELHEWTMASQVIVTEYLDEKTGLYYQHDAERKSFRVAEDESKYGEWQFYKE